jgi:Lrp/AsnC family transcriptional regulator
VVECHTLMGDVDFLLKVIVTDIDEYEHFFWQELSQIEGVQEVSSSISMTQVQETTALPL